MLQFQSLILQSQSWVLISFIHGARLRVPESYLAISELGTDIFHSWSRIHTNIILLARSKRLLLILDQFQLKSLRAGPDLINIRGESKYLWIYEVNQNIYEFTRWIQTSMNLWCGFKYLYIYKVDQNSYETIRVIEISMNLWGGSKYLWIKHYYLVILRKQLWV